ncbi:MAG: hypothetical protein IKM18_01645 [Clostridia bacterium]|nr:hypothetical protein [Clostridia bacterium]
MKKLTKSTLSLMLVLCMLLLSFTACDDKDAQIKMTYLDAQDDNGKILSSEHAEYLKSVWEKCDWESGAIKSHCDYCFEFNGRVIKYSTDHGSFNDETKQRCIIVSDEQRAHINSVIIGMQADNKDDDSVDNSALTVSDIKEGMKYSEIVEILGTNGENVGSGAIIYEWQISDEEYLYVWFNSTTASGGENFPADLIASSVEIRKERLHLAPVD